jgi:hypothetical protein
MAGRVNAASTDAKAPVIPREQRATESPEMELKDIQFIYTKNARLPYPILSYIQAAPLLLRLVSIPSPPPPRLHLLPSPALPSVQIRKKGKLPKHPINIKIK